MNFNFFVILFFIFTSATQSFAFNEPKPFTTDLCTGFPNGTPKYPNQWAHCCVIHDLYLWAGGVTQDSKMNDLRLKSCVEETGAKAIAKIMYDGIRLGSHSPYKLKGQHWGNAWGDESRKTALTRDEIHMLEVSLKDSPNQNLSDEIIDVFFKTLEVLNLPFYTH